MNNIVRFKIIPEGQLNYFIKKGWVIQEKKEDGDYAIGLPIERAYQDATKIVKFLLQNELVEMEMQRRAKLYGKDFSDYKAVHKSKINIYCDGDNYTHEIDKDDVFNKEINSFLSLFPTYQEVFYAKPIKRD